MDVRMLCMCLAVLFAFGFAQGATKVVTAAFAQRKASLVAQGLDVSVANLALWRLRSGFPFLVPVSKLILSNGKVASFVDEATRMLQSRGIATDSEKLVSVVLIIVGVAALVAGVVASSFVASLAVPACCVVAAVVFVGHERDRQREAARDAVPAALESMASCFGSGFTLQQTFEQVAHDIDGPLAATFRRSAHILEMGGGSERALRELWHGSHATELAFVAVALDIQHQSGGSMRQVLEAASETVKGELALRRSLRVQTAQAQLSARIVALMPLVLISVLSLISPDFLSPFFESIQGYALLALAVIMQVAGIVLVRKTLAVEGVS